MISYKTITIPLRAIPIGTEIQPNAIQIRKGITLLQTIRGRSYRYMTEITPSTDKNEIKIGIPMIKKTMIGNKKIKISWRIMLLDAMTGRGLAMYDTDTLIEFAKYCQNIGFYIQSMETFIQRGEDFKDAISLSYHPSDDEFSSKENRIEKSCNEIKNITDEIDGANDLAKFIVWIDDE